MICCVWYLNYTSVLRNTEYCWLLFWSCFVMLPWHWPFDFIFTFYYNFSFGFFLLFLFIRIRYDKIISTRKINHYILKSVIQWLPFIMLKTYTCNNSQDYIKTTYKWNMNKSYFAYILTPMNVTIVPGLTFSDTLASILTCLVVVKFFAKTINTWSHLKYILLPSKYIHCNKSCTQNTRYHKQNTYKQYIVPYWKVFATYWSLKYILYRCKLIQTKLLDYIPSCSSRYNSYSYVINSTCKLIYKTLPHAMSYTTCHIEHF